ncbi:hypothetical protein CKO51_28120 [Rhodopirellula sp. SM50]|nr:hypothetical protein CKO51_28120 [Rhodopirellula sp. SM50]
MTPHVSTESFPGRTAFTGILSQQKRGRGFYLSSADNRKLHYDQYCMLVLLYVLNPTVSSLRALTQASELAKVQKRLSSSKTSLGSLSEASRVFGSKKGRGFYFSSGAIKQVWKSQSACLTDWVRAVGSFEGRKILGKKDGCWKEP